MLVKFHNLIQCDLGKFDNQHKKCAPSSSTKFPLAFSNEPLGLF